MKNSILWDCHMHSSFSADSDTDMENMIKNAISRGLEGVCFTEHLDPDYPPTPDQQVFHLEVEAYADRLAFLKEKYKDSITVNFGIEYGLQPHLKKHFSEQLSRFPFDFVIGSSHVVHGQDPYYGEYFKNREEARGYREYFESILENLDVFSEWMYTDISTILYATAQTKIFITAMNDIRIFLTKYFVLWSVKISGLN